MDFKYIVKNEQWQVEEIGNIFKVKSFNGKIRFDIYIVNEYDDFSVSGADNVHYSTIDLAGVLQQKIFS